MSVSIPMVFSGVECTLTMKPEDVDRLVSILSHFTSKDPTSPIEKFIRSEYYNEFRANIAYMRDTLSTLAAGCRCSYIQQKTFEYAPDPLIAFLRSGISYEQLKTACRKMSTGAALVKVLDKFESEQPR